MVNNTQSHEFVSIELVNGILMAVLKCETLDLQIAKASVNYRLKFYADKDYPLIVNIKTVKHVTKGARDYLASMEGCDKVSFCGIITNSMITKFLANFFISINKPLVPTKVFNSEEAAIQWLTSINSN